VERETYESALNFGRHALEKLGLSERLALKAAVVFRKHDDELFRELQKSYGRDEYVSATRASRETWERLIRAEIAQLAEEEEKEGGRDGGEASRRVEAGGERV
jgi:glutathione-regulated potassium-efflux system ancillary protein KefC/glutathione-regulated potassium-efflux system protein KefB